MAWTRPRGRLQIWRCGVSRLDPTSRLLPPDSIVLCYHGRAMEESELREAARRQLTANLRRGISPWTGKPYSFAWPSTQTYPYQWFWGSCFHAIVWPHLDLEQAQEELRTLLRG